MFLFTIGDSLPNLSFDIDVVFGEEEGWIPFVGDIALILACREVTFCTWISLLWLFLVAKLFCIALFWQGVEDVWGITTVEKSQDLGDRRDRRFWWCVVAVVPEIIFAFAVDEIGGDGWESGEEFLILPRESDSVADEDDSSTLNPVSPSLLAPLAWSAISKEIKKWIYTDWLIIAKAMRS